MILNKLKGTAAAIAILSPTFAVTPVQADEIEVLHLWTSAGQAAAVKKLKEGVEGLGHTWKDFAVAGGGGENLMTALKSRTIAGKPPAAAQMKAPVVREWAEQGFLVDIDDVAAENNWNKLLPPAIQKLVQIDGKYMAAPVNIHRIDWMWVSPKALEKAGAKVPTTWDEFFVAAKKIQDAGLTAFAHGGQNWQDITVFETVVLGVAGPDVYRKAFVELDASTIKGDAMTKSFETFRRLSKFVDKDSPGRAWNETTAMLIRGEGAFQIMGDWVKGDFTAAGLKADKDYLCVEVPGTQGSFIYNTDSFGMFKLPKGQSRKGQKDLAKTIMGKDFQYVFNVKKGSIPVRNDVDLSDFDACAQKSAKHLTVANAKGNTVPSIAHNMATSPAVLGAARDVVTQFWNQPTMSAKQAQDLLAKAVSNSF